MILPQIEKPFWNQAIQTKQNNLHSESNHYVNFMGILNELFYELKLNAKFSYISLTSSITSDNPANTM